MWSGGAHNSSSRNATTAEAAPVLRAGALKGSDGERKALLTTNAPAAGTAPVHSKAYNFAGPTAARFAAAPAGVDSAKIVHAGSLGLIVPKGQVTPVLTKLTGLAKGFNGYVSSSTTSESGTTPTGTVVLRIPADSFDAALAQARTYGKVTTSSSSAKDVTASYKDLNAQIVALKKTRDHYLTLLASAKTIGETLAVQQRVDDGQMQADQLQGQVNVL